MGFYDNLKVFASSKEFDDYFSDTDNIKILKDKSAESDDRKEVAGKIGTYSIEFTQLCLYYNKIFC